MNEQKLVNVHVDPSNPAEAMDRIRTAAGKGSWRIVSMVSFDDAGGAKQVSPGNNDPHRLEGRPVLVLLEEDDAGASGETRHDLLQAVN